MLILRTGAFAGAGLAVRIAAGLALTKIVATSLGPAGFAIVAHFQNFWTVALMLSGGVFATGITREIAKHSHELEKKALILRTAVNLCMKFALTVAFLLFLAIAFAPTSLPTMLQTHISSGWMVIPIFVSLPLVALYTVTLAVLNGLGLTGRHVFITSFQAVLLLIFSSLLVSAFGLHGAMLALVATPCFMLLFSAAFWAREPLRAIAKFRARDLHAFQSSIAKSLFKFSLASATAAIVVPFSQIAIREYISASFGSTEAGNWQAANKISETYLLLISSTIALYLLPRVSKPLVRDQLWREIGTASAFLVPVTSVLAILIWVFKDWILSTFLSLEFSGATQFLKWQLVGDVFRAILWILAYSMIGQGYLRSYIFLETMAAGLLVYLTYFLTANGVVHYASMAYALTNLAYLIACIAVLLTQSRSK